MRVTTLHGARDLRIEEHPLPIVSESTDAVVKVVAGGVCGSDLWWYRGLNPLPTRRLMGHEVVGVVETTGSAVTRVKPGDFVVVPFCHADGTCVACRGGVQSACLELGSTVGGQGEYVRVAHADACLFVADPPADDLLLRSLLTLTDVLATGWHAARCAGVAAGRSAVVVGDGAVGLCGVLAASILGADPVIALSGREPRQGLASAFGATQCVGSRGQDAVRTVRRLTEGVGAHAVLECVGTGDAMEAALQMARPGATVGFVGIPHGVELPITEMFRRNVGVRGGIAPVQRYLPHLAEMVLSGRIEPGRVLDREVTLDAVAEGYQAMDTRQAVKVLVRM